MAIINIDDLRAVREVLDSATEPIFVCDGIDQKFVILTIEDFYELMDYKELDKCENPNDAFVKIIAGDETLTYEEYEEVRQKLIEAFDKNFKPKADKLN